MTNFKLISYFYAIAGRKTSLATIDGMRSRSQPDEYRIAVKDDGIGFDENIAIDAKERISVLWQFAPKSPSITAALLPLKMFQLSKRNQPQANYENDQQTYNHFDCR